MLQLFCKDYDFNNLFLLYLIFTGEALPHLPPLTACPCLVIEARVFQTYVFYTIALTTVDTMAKKTKLQKKKFCKKIVKKFEAVLFQN